VPSVINLLTYVFAAHSALNLSAVLLASFHQCLYQCSSVFISGDFEFHALIPSHPYSFCLSFRICSKIDSAQPGGSGPLLKSNFIPNANFHRSIHKIPVPT